MILDAASSSTCSGASAGGPSAGSPQNHPALPRTRPGPHRATAGSSGPATSASLTPLVFTRGYFHVKSFEIKISMPLANGGRTSVGAHHPGNPDPPAPPGGRGPAGSMLHRAGNCRPDAPSCRRSGALGRYGSDASYVRGYGRGQVSSPGSPPGLG